MFRITFEDNTNFTGQSQDGSWDKAPEKKIQALEYFYNKKEKAVFMGYREYNHVIEHYWVSGKNMIAKVLIMTREKDQTLIWGYDFQYKRFIEEYVDYGREYGNMILRGWKEGVVQDKPLFQKFRVAE